MEYFCNGEIAIVVEGGREHTFTRNSSHGKRIVECLEVGDEEGAKNVMVEILIKKFNPADTE